MTNWVPEIGFLGNQNQPKNGLKASWTRFFFIFLPNFCHIWWFFKVSQHLRYTPLWKIIKYGKILAKRRKALFNLPSTHFSTALQVPETRASGTRPTELQNYHWKFLHEIELKNPSFSEAVKGIVWKMKIPQK